MIELPLQDMPIRQQDARRRVKHALTQEILAIRALEKSVNRDFFRAIDALLNRQGKIVLSGVGKSGFIAMKTAATLTSLGHEATFLNPLDAVHGDMGIVREGDVLILFSFSGNTAELLRLVRYIRKNFSVTVLSVTGNAVSQLASLSDYHIAISVKDEGSPLGLAPMASTTATLVVGDLIASALTDPTTFKKEHFARFHPAGSLGLSLKKVKEIMHTGKAIPCVTNSATFGEALREISAKKLGIVGVCSATGALVGVVTDGDVRRIVSVSDTPRNVPVKKVMKKSPLVINDESSLKEALLLMEERKITSLFVTDQKKQLCGVVHIHDILEETIRP